MRTPLSIIAALLTGLLLAGCLARPVVERKEGPSHYRQNEVIREAVVGIARSGDWLVTRGYHATDHLVANATGIPISHVGVYDADVQMVVEAEGKGVHRSTLADFVDKSYRLLVIRPRWSTEENGPAAAARAGELVGRSYDFMGTIGFNYPHRYYCSELAVEIYRPWHGQAEVFPGVIKPGALYLYGTVLYDSKPRVEW